ncbi:PTS system, ascorbate-specific IIA component [Pelagirhabdus alkalitolerans]|uniref:Ascorbate-specific PTS system EIIA component n=1 Tax=Pelagirhabdus alkalitolerans TaxID=1612202 RepID=A0A1G6JR14_9BACI|nr:PTS sugar transporter subunit IIA [Pelagirhabdus alkalitolerans]SDC21202.1 PTS system, ascorbate-specific IIA component [Pelagirhabdus alkalitolerans]
MLKEYLKDDYMQHVSCLDSWEEAIAVAADPLLKSRIIEESYIQAMIDSVEKNGPYIVLKDYFALPHAKAGEGVNDVGLSLLLLDEPVDLKGNPVKVFLVLAAVDHTSHLKALSEISELLMNDETYEQFLANDLAEIKKLL